MYLTISGHSFLGQPPAPKAPQAQYRPPFSSGGEYIGDDDGKKLLTVLFGPSPFQGYLKRSLAARGSALPSKLLRIVSSTKAVPERLRKRFTKVGGKIVGGTIDRSTGIIYLLPAPGARAHTRVEFALHEAVHLLAHPGADIVDDAAFRRDHGDPCHKGETDVGSFQRKYCTGFGEGATQVITEMILKAQGISKYSGDRPYSQFTPPVRKLIEIFSLDRIARAYFEGAITELTTAMEARWGKAWRNVANFTSTGNTKLALNEIEKLENAAWERSRRPSPPGDYPTLPTTTRTA